MASAQNTAPAGYNSNFAALLDLLRFGFAIWGPVRMAVLLFHAERSTAYGKLSDQHSKTQALNGVYSKPHGTWIRGPAGVSNGTLARENKALLQEGMIKRFHRQTSGGGCAARLAPESAVERAARRSAALKVRFVVAFFMIRSRTPA